MKFYSLLLMALSLPPLLTNAVGQSKQSQFQLKQCNVANPENTPRPVFPVPSRRQMLWNETEFYAFFHYGMDTYTGKEWGHSASYDLCVNSSRLGLDATVEFIAGYVRRVLGIDG